MTAAVLARTPSDIARQTRWEMLGIERARREADTAIARAEAAGRTVELPPGQKLLADVIKPFTARIKAAQQEAVAGASQRGADQRWWWPIGLLPADKAAVLTVACCLRTVPVKGEIEVGFQGGSLWRAALLTADCYRDQVEYEQWEQQQRDLSRDAKERAHEAFRVRSRTALGLVGATKEDAAAAGREASREELAGHTDLLKAFSTAYPNANRRTWGKWRSKIKALREVAWDEISIKMPLGTKLVHELVAAAPDRFSIVDVRQGLHVNRLLKLSESTKAEMRDTRARMLVARPRLMPMIVPPNPWRYEP